MPAYDLTAPYSPKGDQPTAITQLVEGVNDGRQKGRRGTKCFYLNLIL